MPYDEGWKKRKLELPLSNFTSSRSFLRTFVIKEIRLEVSASYEVILKYGNMWEYIPPDGVLHNPS